MVRVRRRYQSLWLLALFEFLAHGLVVLVQVSEAYIKSTDRAARQLNFNITLDLWKNLKCLTTFLWLDWGDDCKICYLNSEKSLFQSLYVLLF